MGTRIEDLTNFVQGIAKKHALRHGIKNMLSAGVLLFDKLNDKERNRAIDEANGLDVEQGKPISEAPQAVIVDKKKVLTDAIKNIKKLGIDKTTRIKIIDSEEQDLINKLRGLLGPDEPHKQAKKIV